jgi:hypothetical protein
MEIVEYGGWDNNVRISNGRVELIITKDVGPRIIRFGFIGERNVFFESKAQMGGKGEKDWKIRGGHRLWISPEEKPKTYELDNFPIEAEEIKDGARVLQPMGQISGVRKTMDVVLSPKTNDVTIVHTLTSMRKRSVLLSPWALTAMAPKGTAVIPMPEKIPHTERLTHNQVWSLWGYTDLTDDRWTIGRNYLLFRQDIKRGPSKLGIAHAEGWVAYHVGEYLFVKKFEMIDGEEYPDGGVNFETFANQEFLELESLGPVVSLEPGKSVSHQEKWALFKGVHAWKTEADMSRQIRKLVG